MFKPVRKAIFPVGGQGTRFLPATKAVPKEMLPVVDRPLLQYAVDEALAAGIEQMIFVTALAAVLRNWQYHSIAWIVIGVVALLGLVFFTVVPFIRWRTEHFVITNFHVFFRTGILHRREHQIPLGHIQNMETSVTFWGRLLGYGSLIVESAADQPLEFENVASLSKVQSTLNQLIMDDRNRYQTGPDGVPGPGGAQYPPTQYPPAQYPPAQYPPAQYPPAQGRPQQ